MKSIHLVVATCIGYVALVSAAPINFSWSRDKKPTRGNSLGLGLTRARRLTADDLPTRSSDSLLKRDVTTPVAPSVVMPLGSTSPSVRRGLEDLAAQEDLIPRAPPSETPHPISPADGIDELD